MLIEDYATKLKLPHIKEAYAQALLEAKQGNWSHQELLEHLLEGEYQLRMENGMQTRINRAKFPQKKYLMDFERKLHNYDTQMKFNELVCSARIICSKTQFNLSTLCSMVLFLFTAVLSVYSLMNG